MMGDSTHRQLYESVAHIMARLRYDIQMVFPHANGMPIRNRDNHKDTDTVFESVPNTKCHSCTTGVDSRLHHLSLHNRSARNSSNAVLFSMRFLRGLDLHKLDHVIKDWRQRYHYTEWLHRSGARPALMVYDSDRFDQHPLTRYHFAERRAPDAIIFHACGWDLPHVNRSHYYYGWRTTKECDPPPTDAIVFQEKRLPNGTIFKGTASVRVVGSPCIHTGEDLTDEEILAGFEAKLREAVTKLRASFTGRLMLRSCHAGVQDGRAARDGRPRAQPQFEALVHMDRIVRRVAHDLCVELLDVMAVDAAAGWHEHNHSENFHVPPGGAERAARAALTMLASQSIALPISSGASNGSSQATCMSTELDRQITDRTTKSCSAPLVREGGNWVLHRHVCAAHSKQQKEDHKHRGTPTRQHGGQPTFSLPSAAAQKTH